MNSEHRAGLGVAGWAFTQVDIRQRIASAESRFAERVISLRPAADSSRALRKLSAGRTLSTEEDSLDPVPVGKHRFMRPQGAP